jgi:ABC-type antimicrobial peptide transport system permease subunit
MLKVERKELLSATHPDDWAQIVGVVGDALNDGLDHPTKPAVFLPYSFILPTDEQLFVRVAGNPDAVQRSIKERLQQLNPELVAGRDHSLSWWLETAGWGQERFIATLFSLFAFLALALAATGLYSVVSYAVTQRTQEVGIRMALGAPRASIVRLVLASNTRVLAIGIAAGLILSVSLNGVITTWSKGSSSDPATLLAAATLLVLVAVAACVFPAWRAATIDPMLALRHE